MRGVVPPVVVVEPADEVADGGPDRGDARIGLAGAVVRTGGDARVADPGDEVDRLPLAVVDDDRLPVRLALRPEAREGALELRRADLAWAL